MEDRKSRLAILGSLIWVALATGIVLGTHGSALADADGFDVPRPAAAVWSALPAMNTEPVVNADCRVDV